MNNIFIPKKINVGFQERYGTYTGKLAYIIYFDEKGVLRKEKSWNSWREKNIESEIFENVPTEGFVLNKKVGGYSLGWNHRQTYTRVYDPRGFEFEITVENLLYILENTSSIKGKGLEGEFVYGWDGKDLVLMPVSTPDYIEITKFNNIIHNNLTIKAKDLIVGSTYLTKDNEELVYMGRYDYYYPYSDCNKGKHYWFSYKSNNEWSRNKYEFHQWKSLPKNKFISIVSEDPSEMYSEMHETMECNRSYSPIDKSKNEYVKYTLEEFIESMMGNSWSSWFYDDNCVEYRIYRYNDDSTTSTLYKKCEEEYRDWYSNTKKTRMSEFKVCEGTLEEIFELVKPNYLNEYLANNKLYRSGKNNG